MIFMLSSRPKPGFTRAELISHLTDRLGPSTWDLIRKCVLSSVYPKVGDEPGFFAVLSAPNIEQTRALVDSSTHSHEIFDPEIVPVSPFPQFD